MLLPDDLIIKENCSKEMIKLFKLKIIYYSFKEFLEAPFQDGVFYQ